MTLDRPNRRQFVAAGATAIAWPQAALAAAPADLRAAFHYAFPIFEFARTGAASLSLAGRAQPNEIGHRRGLADHTARAITTPNNDTVYSSARLDLSNGPVLLDVPTLKDRYFSVAFMDAYTDNFAYVGTRTTGGEGGPTLVVGPRWRGRLPSGTRLIRSPTTDVWMLGRILVSGPADLAAANAAQDGLKIVSAAAPAPLGVTPTSAEDPENLLAVVNAVLARSPGRDPVGRRARRFAAAGIVPGRAEAWARLSPDVQAAWRAGIPQWLAELRSGGFGGARHAGWNYPPPGVGAPGANDALRSLIALSGLAALEREEAVYMRGMTDTAGAPLTGANRYRLRLPGDIPVKAFWSLSMYQFEPDGRLFFVDNPLRRYAIGDRTPGLPKGPDGAVTVLMQATDPGPLTDAVWLPAPAGPFNVTFRGYIPGPGLLGGTWRLPGIERI